MDREKASKITTRTLEQALAPYELPGVQKWAFDDVTTYLWVPQYLARRARELDTKYHIIEMDSGRYRVEYREPVDL